MAKKPEALAPSEGQALERRKENVAVATFAPMEGFSASDKSGKEGITSEDMRLPFLVLTQKTSKAVDETDDAYVEGLKFGEMYNSETKEIYGKGPLTFLPLRHRKRAYLPDENGRMGEQISWGDRRCTWPTPEEKKKGKDKPEGVRVYDWVVLLLVEGAGPTLAVISFKSTSFTAGQTLTTFVNMIQGPAFTGKFSISVQLDENESGKFGRFAISPAGKPSREEADVAKAIYDSIKDREIATEEDVEAGGQGSAGPAVDAKDVPF